MSKDEIKKWFADMKENLQNREPTLKEVLYEQRVLSAMQTRSASRRFIALSGLVVLGVTGIIFCM
tara:strand:- start:291 stop:485 length:195 start_codon:yes stop_codon:yes gene_type:complete